MTTIVFAMLGILVLAAVTGVVVLMGIEGMWRNRAPKLAHKMGRTAQSLNGDAKPPRRLMRMFS